MIKISGGLKVIWGIITNIVDQTLTGKAAIAAAVGSVLRHINTTATTIIHRDNPTTDLSTDHTPSRKDVTISKIGKDRTSLVGNILPYIITTATTTINRDSLAMEPTTKIKITTINTALAIIKVAIGHILVGILKLPGIQSAGMNPTRIVEIVPQIRCKKLRMI